VTDFDIDLDGELNVRESLNDLERDWTDSIEVAVESGAEYSAYLEFGTRHMPPYPFFRPAIREFKRNPEGFITDNTEYNSVREIESADQLILSVGAALESKMKVNVTAQGNSLDRSPGTDPEHPRSGFQGEFEGRVYDNTGNLRARIGFRVI